MSHRRRRKRQERRRNHAERPGWRIRNSLITGAGLTAGAVVGLSSPAFGADYTVTNTFEPGDGSCDGAGCTLREAINAANAHAGPDRILFQAGLSGTITLGAYGALPITGPTYIYGPGPDKITVSGDNAYRVFNINETTPGDPAFIYGLSMIDGYVSGSGGAVHDSNSTLEIVHSVISGSHATVSGGGVDEAGAFNFGYSSQIIASTISGNTAVSNGGGVNGENSFGTIRNSTISGNQASYGGGARSQFDATVKGSTVSGNTATSTGGGLYGANGLHVNSSIVANSTGGDVFTPAGILAATYSLFENPSTTVGGGAHNIIGADPLLGPLQDNGGGIPTLKPGAGSPVVDQGKSFSTFDQRLMPRTIDNPSVSNVAGGDGTDIGSVELSIAENTPPPSAANPPSGSPPVAKKCKKKKHKSSAQIAKKCKKKRK